MPLRHMTYNIRHGRGVDGKVDLGRIAAVIAARDPDVVTLQEVDFGRFRSGLVDQAEQLAKRLHMEERFLPVMDHDEDGHYGIATLTRLPVTGSHQVVELPRSRRPRFSEPRSALVTTVGWHGGELDVINTHLSLRPDERGLQATALAEFLGDDEHDLVMSGDFNCGPDSGPLRSLLTRLRRVHVARPSWPSRFPLLRLDHVFYRGEIAASDAEVVNDRLARRASDHLPVIARFDPHGRGPHT